MQDILYTQEQQIDDELVGFAIAQRGVDWYAARYVLPLAVSEAGAGQVRSDVGHALTEQLGKM